MGTLINEVDIQSLELPLIDFIHRARSSGRQCLFDEAM
jgi:hypothetical protein